jgi:xylono-1,5-lactonase
MRFEVILSGYGVVESPAVDDEGRIAFSDVSRGGVYRMDRQGVVETLVPKRKGVGGLCLHEDGGYIVSGRDISYVKDGVSSVIFAPDDCPPPGPIEGFNDLCADHNGSILIGPVQLNAARDGKAPQNFIRVDAPHSGKVLYPDVRGSNGVAVDPKRRRIYHAETGARMIIVSEIRDDDTVAIVRRFSTEAVEGIPDGLRIDAEGCVWVAFYRGGSVARFDADGKLLTEIRPPSRLTTCVCFAGADMMDLYIGTHDNTDHPELEGCLFLTRAPVPGIAPPRARVAHG